jgi:integrase
MKNFKGNVYRVAGFRGGYRGQIAIGKKRRYKYFFGDKKTCSAKCREWQEQEFLRRGKNRDGSVSWLFFREKWEEDARGRSEPLSERTIIQYRCNFDKLERYLKPTYLNDITLMGLRRAVTEMKDDARKSGYDNTGVNLFIILIRHAFKWAMNAGYMEDFPIENLMTVGVGKRSIKTNDIREIELLLKYGTTQERARVLFGFDCGLRPEEKLNLLWEKLNLDTGFGWISENKYGWKPKRDKERQFLMTQRLMAELKKLPRVSEYVFTNDKGQKFSSSGFSASYADFVNKVNEEIARNEPEKIKITSTCRTLRKDYSTHRQAQGAGEEDISKSMGHADIKVTKQHYTNNQQEELRRLKEENERERLLELKKYEVPLKIEKAT